MRRQVRGAFQVGGISEPVGGIADNSRLLAGNEKRPSPSIYLFFFFLRGGGENQA